MKTIIAIVIALCFTTSAYAHNTSSAHSHGMKHKVPTVEGIIEYRALVVKRMNERLVSGDLTDEQQTALMRRIVAFEARELPTQEQIDKRSAQKRKAWKKRKFRHRRKA